MVLRPPSTPATDDGRGPPKSGGGARRLPRDERFGGAKRNRLDADRRRTAALLRPRGHGERATDRLTVISTSRPISRGWLAPPDYTI